MTSKLSLLVAMAALSHSAMQSLNVNEAPPIWDKPKNKASYKSDKPKVRSGSFKRNKRKSK